MKRIALILALCAALLLCAFAGAEEAVYSHLGETLPDFTVTTIDGETFTLSEALKEKDMVLINLWATWCGPCEMEFPYMEEAYEQYQDKVEIIALSVEENDTVDVLTEYVDSHGMTFPVGNDSTVGLGNTFATVGIPTTLAIDRFGVITFIEIGSQPSTSAFTRLFDYFVGEDYTETQVLEELPPMLPTVPNATEAELAEALNVEGGTLAFTNDPDETVWPFVPEEIDGRKVLVSTNAGNGDSESAVLLTVNAAAGDVLAFNVWTSTEAALDVLKVVRNGQLVKIFSGEHDWTDWAIALEEGENEISFRYLKDWMDEDGEDKVRLDEVRVLSGEEAATALAALPTYPVGDELSITVLNPDAREIIFRDPEGVMEEYYACQKYFIVPGGFVDAGITLTAEIDPEGAFAYNNYDGMILPLIEFVPEEGNLYVVSGYIDSMAETGYPYSNIYVYPTAESYEDVVGVMLFVDEENANAVVVSMADEGYVVSWGYADGSSASTDAVATGESAVSEYEAYFIDQNGDAVPGCVINFCTDETCVPCRADENGLATFSGMPYPYHLQVIRVPEGYTFDTKQEFTADPAGEVLTFVVEKNAE